MLVKEVLHKLVLIIWFHLYEVLGQIKVIEVNKIKTSVASGSGSRRKGLTGEEFEGTFWSYGNIPYLNKSLGNYTGMHLSEVIKCYIII